MSALPADGRGGRTALSSIEERLREAVARYGSAVMARCRALVDDPHAAEDLAQEVFARLCELVSSPRRSREDVPWGLIEAILRNVLCEHMRRKAKIEQNLWLTLKPEAAPDPPWYDDGAARQWESLHELIQLLRPAHQRVLLARHLLGMRLNEIADWLELPHSTVTDQYNQAIYRLRILAKRRGLLP